MQKLKFREDLVERFRHIGARDYFDRYGLQPRYQQGGLRLHRSLQEISQRVHNALVDQFTREELEGIQYLVRPRFGVCPGGAMMVQLDPSNGIIHLVMDPLYLAAMLDSAESLQIAPYLVEREIGWLVRHELWHVLLGHNYTPLQYASRPLYHVAVETAVNDGALAIGASEPAYPFLALSRIGLLEEANRVASELQLPPDWLIDFRQVLQVLEQLELQQQVSASFLQGADDQQELVIQHLRTGRVYRFGQYGYGDPQPLDTVDELDQFLRDLLPHLGPQFQYDPARMRYRYSRSGFESHERVLRPRALHLPWHRISQVLDARRRPGFDRRRRHLYPPDEQPLLSRQQDRSEEVLVYLDSSGSVPDEVLSTFLGTARRSPYRIRIFYFSTEVTSQPGTGGTDYRCIVEHVQRYLQTASRRLRAVLVFTDGHAEPVTVPIPERWYWVVIGDDSVPRQCGGHVLRAIESIG